MQRLALQWALLVCSPALALGLELAQPANREPVLHAVPSTALFGSCLQAVRQGSSAQGAYANSCETAFGAVAPGLVAKDDCSEFAGRALEAKELGYLGGGELLCGRLAKEHAVRTKRSLASYVPTSGGQDMKIFCDALRVEAIPACAPALAASVATPAFAASVATPAFFTGTGLATAGPIATATNARGFGPIATATSARGFGQGGALFNQGMVRASAARAPLVPVPQPDAEAGDADVWANLNTLLHK